MAKRKISKLKTFFAGVLSFILGLAASFVCISYLALPESYKIPDKVEAEQSQPIVTGQIDKNVVVSNDLSIHFLELGNKYTGDCVLVKSGTTEMLIDAGSKADSVPVIKNYLDTYCTDKTLEYVVVTHAHEDHYAGFATPNGTNCLFDYYQIGTIIEFAQTNKKFNTDKMYTNYVNNRNEAVNNGAMFYSALDCINRTFTLQDFDEATSTSSDVTFEVLDQKYYHEQNKADAKTENNFSVCLQISQGTKNYLFTGDLEEKGEKSLVELNQGKLKHVELYKAGHHGSKTSSSDDLLSVITPNIVCVCCCAGSSEYTSKNANQFPTQEFVNRVSIYTYKIFVTSLCIDYKAGTFTSFNGNIVVCSSGTADTAVYCSNNSTVLKDTDWFKANRKLPANAKLA